MIEIQKLINKMKTYTDMLPWYWIAYGEKCYGFAVVEAAQWEEKDPLPKPGTKLEYGDVTGEWIGENGTKMFINGYIADIEQQNGDTICAFIAAAHAHLIGADAFENNH